MTSHVRASFSRSRFLRSAVYAAYALTAGALLAEAPDKGATPHLGDTLQAAKDTYAKPQSWTESTPGKPVCHLGYGDISVMIFFEGKTATKISYHLLGRAARSLSPEFIRSHVEEQSHTQWTEEGMFEKGRVMKSADGLYAYCTPGNYSLFIFTKAGFEAYKEQSSHQAK